MTEMLFKVLGSHGEPCHGGSGKWSLPKGGRPGKWMPTIENIELCERGYHLCREQDLVLWLGPTLWVAEAKGKRMDGDDKIVVSEARLIRKVAIWDDRLATRFACACAKRALPLYEAKYPGDRRPADAIRAALAWAKNPNKETAAARDAAWAAAGAAAGDAAWAAAGAAAWAAAGAAAGDAARDVARDVARAAAWAAERRWQTRTLMRMLGLRRQG